MDQKLAWPCIDLELGAMTLISGYNDGDAKLILRMTVAFFFPKLTFDSDDEKGTGCLNEFSCPKFEIHIRSSEFLFHIISWVLLLHF